MAHWTKRIGTNGISDHVSGTSRYARTPLQYYTEKKYVTFTTYKRPKVRTSDQDQWLQITKAVEFRPDLVSHEIYGSWEFWWRLMEANGMKDILEFKAGVNIRLPGDIMA